MDFKTLISKLDSMDAPPKTPTAPTLPQAVQLNEDAQLRVLSGRSTYVAEAKKKKDEEKKEEKVDEAAEKTDKPWTDMSGKKHPGTAVKGDKYTGKEAEKEEKKKQKDESIEPQFKSKFMKMVEAKKEESEGKMPSKAHIAKMCKDGKTTAEICKMHPNCDQSKLKEMIKDCKTQQVKEGSKPDFLDLDKDGDKKEPMTQAAADKGGDSKDGGKKGMSDKQAKYFGGGKKNESAMMPKGKKRPVKESVEQGLSFKQMVQLVQESGGQQQIDPVDKALFTWAERVAKNKLGEGMKADLYAGLVYERNGGVFEMYDLLEETK